MDKLKSHPSFEEANQDSIVLLKIIKVILYSFEQMRYQEDEHMTIKTVFYTFKQDNGMLLQQYYELFVGHVNVMDEVGITISDNATAYTIAMEEGHDMPMGEDYAKAKDRALAVRFIQGANPTHNAEYHAHLQNSQLEGNDIYPKTLIKAYHTLSSCEPMRGTSMPLDGGKGVSFATQGQGESGEKNQDGPRGHKSHIKCFNCGVFRHYANQCDKAPKEEVDNQGTAICITTIESPDPEHDTKYDAFSFSQPNDMIPKSWILLDNQSMIDLFCNPKLLSDIRESGTSMRVNCNAGSRVATKVGELKGYGTVWYDPHGIANILSLKNVRKKYAVAYNQLNRAFMVTKPDGTVFMFIE